jgi:hypothetical protein
MSKSSLSAAIDGGSHADRGSAGFERVIDQALALLQSEWRRIAMGLAPDCIATVDRGQLRDGPIGGDLRRLAAIARGDEVADPGDVQRAVEAVVQLLYWPAGAHTFEVPERFWQTELGSMLVQATARSRHAVRVGRVKGVARVDATEPVVLGRDDRSLTGALGGMEQLVTEPGAGQQEG